MIRALRLFFFNFMMYNTEFMIILYSDILLTSDIFLRLSKLSAGFSIKVTGYYIS